MQTTTDRRRHNGAAASDAEATASATDPLAERLRANVRRLATAHGLSLAELGRLIGHPNGNALYNLLNGWSDSLSARTLMRMADVFGVSLDALTGRRTDAGLPDGQAAPPAAAIVQAQRIATGLDEARQALRTARDAVDTAERAVHAAAALLPSSRPAD